MEKELNAAPFVTTNGTDVKTRILRNTSSIYKRLGLNFRPQRRKQIEFLLTNTNESSHEISSRPISSEVVLHEPVYSKIASPTNLRKAQAVIPLCVGLKTLISPSNDEKESCRNEDDDKTSVNFHAESEKLSIVEDDHFWLANQRRTSWIDDTASSEIRVQHSVSSQTISPSMLDAGVNFRRFSMSPSDVFLRDLTPEIEISSDSNSSERSMRDSGIVLHDDIGPKPVFTRNSTSDISSLRSQRLLSPYDGRTSLNKNEIGKNNCHTAVVAKVVHYDSETLRKTAQKNRETAAKLLPRLQKKRNSLAKDYISGGKSTSHQRRETQTSSSSKSSASPRASSVFTDSSSGGGSSGSYDVLSFHDILTEYHDQQRKQLTWRSISNENFESASSSGGSSPFRHSSANHIVSDRQQFDAICKCESACQQDNRQSTKKKVIRRGIFIEKETPIYAVPQKFVQVVSTNRSSDMKISENMKNSPPPLPRKPPPSLDDDDEHDEDDMQHRDSTSSESESLEDMNPKMRSTVTNEASSSRRTSFDDVISASKLQFRPSIFAALDDENNHRTSSFSGDSSISINIIPKRPIVPVHPYNEKINQGKCNNGNDTASSYLVVQLHENLASPVSNGCGTYRPPVPPKPDKATVKTPPQLPPKPTNFTLKRTDMNSSNITTDNSHSESSSKCRRDSSPPNDDNVCNSAPRRCYAANDEDVLWQEHNIDLESPGRRSVDFVSIVYDRLSSSCEKKRRLYRLDESRNLNGECSDCGDGASPSSDIVESEKKVLLSKLNNKLVVLKKAYREIEQEIRFNDNIGRRLDVLIEKSDRLTTYDKQKYRLHVEDTEKLAHLFLKLSAQLARVENDLDRMPPTSSPKEKQHFTERRQRLLVQLTDAKNLKDDLDRRCENVTTMLREILTDEQIGDYENYIDMKSRLLVDARDIEENVNLLEERRNFMEQSLNSTRN